MRKSNYFLINKMAKAYPPRIPVDVDGLPETISPAPSPLRPTLKNTISFQDPSPPPRSAFFHILISHIFRYDFLLLNRIKVVSPFVRFLNFSQNLWSGKRGHFTSTVKFSVWFNFWKKIRILCHVRRRKENFGLRLTVRRSRGKNFGVANLRFSLPVAFD